MTSDREQQLLSGDRASARDEWHEGRPRRPYPPETPKCRKCNGKLYGDEIATGLCGQTWCVEWRKEAA